MIATRWRGIWQRVLDLERVHVYAWPEPPSQPRPEPPSPPGTGTRPTYRVWPIAEVPLRDGPAVSDYLRHAVTDWPLDWPAESRPGARVHALEEHAALIAWGFTVTGVTQWPIEETGTMLHCAPSDLLMLGYFTEPTHRGRGLYPNLLRAILEHTPRAGRAMIWVQRRNRPSEKAIVRTGFARVATHWGLKAGGLPVWRRRTGGAA